MLNNFCQPREHTKELQMTTELKSHTGEPHYSTLLWEACTRTPLRYGTRYKADNQEIFSNSGAIVMCLTCNWSQYFHRKWTEWKEIWLHEGFTEAGRTRHASHFPSTRYGHLSLLSKNKSPASQRSYIKFLLDSCLWFH